MAFRLLPVRKVEVAAQGASFASAISYDYTTMEAGQLVEEELSYTDETGRQPVYAIRRELVWNVFDFGAADAATIRGWGRVDVRYTLGLPGDTDDVRTMLDTRVRVGFSIDRGDATLKLSAGETLLPSGAAVPWSQLRLGRGESNLVADRVSVDFIEARVGLQVVKYPCRTGEQADIERIVGYKRKLSVTVAPSAFSGIRQGFGSAIDAWLLAPVKWALAYNFFAESGVTTDFRRVVCTNSEELLEERLEGLIHGRNVILDILDSPLNI